MCLFCVSFVFGDGNFSNRAVIICLQSCSTKLPSYLDVFKPRQRIIPCSPGDLSLDESKID